MPKPLGSRYPTLAFRVFLCRRNAQPPTSPSSSTRAAKRLVSTWDIGMAREKTTPSRTFLVYFQLSRLRPEIMAATS